MTNERAFAEAQYAVNHWFKFMDDATRAKLLSYAQGWTPEKAFEEPVIVVAAQPFVRPQEPRGEGRGKANIGKAWVLNRTTGERARVPADELAGYLARGFVQAGPRAS